MSQRQQSKASLVLTTVACLSLSAELLAAQAAGRELPGHLKEPPRLALVVGVEDYPNLPDPSRRVTNAISDAKKIAEVLGSKTLGFNVIPAPQNPAKKTLMNSVTDFKNHIKTVATKAIVVIYFAGHGFQHRGHDYLVAADASAIDLETKSIPVYWLVDELPRDRVAAAIVLIDACRVDVVSTGAGEGPIGSIGRAFVQEGLPNDFQVFYGFASAKGEYAASYARKGETVSPFVAALESKLRLEGVDVARLFIEIRKAVQSVIAHQTPSVLQYLDDQLYLNPTRQCLQQHRAYFSLAKEGGRSCVLKFDEEYPLSPQLGGVYRYLATHKTGPSSSCKEDFAYASKGCDK